MLEIEPDSGWRNLVSCIDLNVRPRKRALKTNPFGNRFYASEAADTDYEMSPTAPDTCLHDRLAERTQSSMT